MLDFKATKEKLNEFLDHINQRHSVCDLVDDKNPEEVDSIKEIWELSGEVYDRLCEINKNP